MAASPIRAPLKNSLAGLNRVSGRAGLSLLLGLAWHSDQPYCGWLARALEGKVLGGKCEQDWGPGRGKL